MTLIVICYCVAAAALVLEFLLVMILYLGHLDLTPAARALHKGCAAVLIGLAVVSFAAMVLLPSARPLWEFGFVSLFALRIGLWHRHLSTKPPTT